jgi:hypothetical protein
VHLVGLDQHVAVALDALFDRLGLLGFPGHQPAQIVGFARADTEDAGAGVADRVPFGDVDEPLQREVKGHVGVFARLDRAVREAKRPALALGDLRPHGVAAVLGDLYLEDVRADVLRGGEGGPDELVGTFHVSHQCDRLVGRHLAVFHLPPE